MRLLSEVMNNRPLVHGDLEEARCFYTLLFESGPAVNAYPSAPVSRERALQFFKSSLEQAFSPSITHSIDGTHSI